MYRARTFALSLLVAATVTAAPAATAQDALREWLVGLMEGSYPRLASQLGLPIRPGTPEWNAAIAASVDAVLAVRPADCGAVRFGVNLCGLRPVHSVSGAMMPTVREGEALMIVPYAEGARPARGDIVLFTASTDLGPRTQYYFRVIALPGETIELREGVVHINGTPLRQEPTGDVLADGGLAAGGRGLEILRETTPEGRSYLVTHMPGGYLSTAGPYPVPENTVFVLGDNRPNSADSRFPRQLGGTSFIPMSAIVGRVAIVYVSADRARIGTRLDPQ